MVLGIGKRVVMCVCSECECLEYKINMFMVLPPAFVMIQYPYTNNNMYTIAWIDYSTEPFLVPEN